MKVRHQLLFLLLFIAFAIITMSFILKWKITSKTEELLEHKLSVSKHFSAPAVLSLNSDYMRSYITDYGIWDQSVNFIQGNAAKNWGDDELKEPLANYKIDYVWVLDSAANYYYSANLKSNAPVQELSIPKTDLIKQFAAGIGTHFFINHMGKMTEVFQGGITYTQDKLRKLKPKGYLLIARIVDEEYLNKVGALSQELKFSFAASKDSFVDQTQAASGVLHFSLPANDFYGKPIAAFNISQSYPVLKSYQDYLDKALLYFTIFIFFTGIIFYYFSKRLFLNPLRIFSKALKQQKSQVLVPYLESKNEFGSLYRLTDNSFKQQEKLVEEIDIRKKKEEELELALAAINSANSEKAKTEQFLKQQQVILEFNNANADADFTTVLKEMLRLAAKTTNCEKLGAWMYENGNAIKADFIYRLSTDNYEEGEIAYENDYPTYFKHLKQDALIIADDAVNNIATLELANDYLIPLGITSMLDVPIRSGNKIIGVVCFEHTGKQRKWSINEQMYARTLADVIAINYEKEQRNKAEELLLKNNLRLEQTQELAKVGSWEINLKTNEVIWSKEMYRIFDLEGIPADKLFVAYAKRLHPDDTQAFLDAANKLVNERQTYAVESRVLCSNGDVKHIVSIGEVIESKRSKKVIGIRGTVQDITQQKLAALAKSEFLSCMSHEIRTPINGVIGIANLLMEEDMTARQQEYVKTLSFSAQHLSTVVSDILDFSKIEAGHMTFEKVSFNLEKNCAYVFDLFANKASEKGIEYRLSTPHVKDYSLYGDYVRLNQILSNLLSNAIKFTDSGSVDLSYKTIEETNHNITVAFSIKDTGIGISEKMQRNIFESFTQADDSITRRYGGTGLGLTICKKLVELQGGTIAINSELGKGTEFIVTLTFDKHVYNNSELKIITTAEKEQERSLNGLKILVAEDNKVNAMILTRFLNTWKAESKVATDGLQALNLLQSESFDLILMDIQMPVLNGIETTERIRLSEDCRMKDIPIVAFTADASVDMHRKLLKIGFNHCMTKPFNPETLFSYLYKLSANIQPV